jgi:hypothetical protein
MAARAIPHDPAPQALPLAPEQRPAVRAAAMLLERAEAEVQRCAAAQAAADSALNAVRERAAAEVLEALETGRAVPPEPADLVDAAAAAGRLLARAQAARDLARLRHAKALAVARVDLGHEVRDQVAELVAAAAVAASEACAQNDSARALLAFGADHSATGLPAVYEGCLKLPSVAQLAGQLAAAHRALTPPEPTPLSHNKVLVRWRAHVPPYLAGDCCGLDQEKAQLQVRAGNAELVDPAQAKELGLDKLVRFDGPVMIQINRDYTTAQRNLIPAGTAHQFDPQTAARIVNLGFGVPE